MTKLVSKLFVQMSRLRPRPVEWAWEGLVPMGKLTLLTGDPGVGKSVVALQVASMVTRGVRTTQELANRAAEANSAKDQRALPRGVLVLSASDHPEETVLPHLIAAGADASRVFFFRGQVVDEPDDKNDDEAFPVVRPFLLSRDMTSLEFCLEELSEEKIDVGLIVIDSIDRYIGAHEKKGDRIEVVAQLADLAARSGAAVLVTANSSMKAGSRGGTVVYQELLNTARSVLMVAPDREDPERRLLLPVKHNLTSQPPGRSFSVEEGVVRWGTEPIPLSADEYLVQARVNKKLPFAREDAREIDRVTQWLEDELREGPVPSDSIQRRATQVDISYGTLRRAAKVLECKVRKQKNQWFWSLPDQPDSECVADHHEQNETPGRDSSAIPQESIPNQLKVTISKDEAGDSALTKEKVLVS